MLTYRMARSSIREGRTMGQRRIVHGASEWYLIASHGDVVVRVRPSMRLGETATGELSFDPALAYLELDIADDGDLMVNAADTHALESTGGGRCRNQRVARHRRAEIRLPHNLLRLDTDFVDRAEPLETVRIRAVRQGEDAPAPSVTTIPGGLPGDRPEPRLTPRPPQRSTLRPVEPAEPAAVAPPPTATPGDESHAPGPVTSPAEPASSRPAADQPQADHQPPATHRRPAADQPTVTHRPPPTHQAPAAHQPTVAHRPPPTQPPASAQQPLAARGLALWRAATRSGWRAPGVRAAALLGLAVFGLLLLNPQSPEVRVSPGPAPQQLQLPDPPARSEPTRPAPSTEAPPATAPVSGAERLEPAPVSPAPAPVSAAEQPELAPATPAASEADLRESPAEQVLEPSAEPEPATSLVIEPVMVPPTLRRMPPPAEPSAGADQPAAALPSAVDTPDPALVAELEAIGDAARAAAAALGRQRDLRAADLALAQDRLVFPPETSAFALYNRVLTEDPGSARARSGLQAVRQGLINRALAQLAGGSLGDARRTLQAAESAGANPMLVADLQSEVNYRQRLVDAQAGRFDSLYPLEGLVAVNRQPPRIPRFAGSDVSFEVQFTVTMEGEVRDVAVLDDPPANLEEAARRAVGDWRFEPVIYEGRPIPVRSSVRFTFRN